MKNLNKFINESHNETYKVNFIDFKDDEGMPITVSVIVDTDAREQFVKFLNDKEGEIFVHAEGRNIEY